MDAPHDIYRNLRLGRRAYGRLITATNYLSTISKAVRERNLPIVSLSFPDQMMKEMDQIQKSSGFAGRSELVRSAVRLLFEDSREKSGLSGHMNAIIVVTHDESNEAPITRLKHEFEDIVKTHIHSKISSNNCVELFLVEGEGKKIGTMSREFQKEDKLKSVKLVVFE